MPEHDEQVQWHALQETEVLEEIGVSAGGISSQEAELRLGRVRNQFARAAPEAR